MGGTTPGEKIVQFDLCKCVRKENNIYMYRVKADLTFFLKKDIQSFNGLT